VTDRWSIGSRLTLNLGFRWDRYHAWVPPQTKVQGPFGNAGNFPAVEVGTWNRPAPRAGFAYNLGGGKTVIKGTYGWFNDDMAEDFSSIYNQNVDVIYTYRWHDLKGDNNYAPGDVNLDPNGPDFLGVSGAPNNIVNTHLKYPHTHELTGSLERELAPGLGLRVLYIYRKLADQVTISNVLRPYTAYSIPLTRRDPGPDGIVNTADDGPMVTIWDYAAAYRGAAFVGNERVNYPSNRRDYFHTLEVTLNKRFSQRWDATVSGSAVKNHASILTTANGEKTTTASATTTSSAVPQSPNDLYFPLNETWDWTARTTTSYVLPFNIRVAALAFFESGAAGQRTYIFRATDPLGGPPLVQQATVTLPLEPYGAHRGPVRDQVNVRFTKLMRLSHGRTVELNADVNNIINSNAAWSSTYQSGPTFGYATNVLPPRLLQFGAAFEF
jgi:hypothetical protein